MVPRQAGAGPGRSFKGAGQYYLHDKREPGEEKRFSSERVQFTHCENLPTQDPRNALKYMAWTAGREKDLKRETGLSTAGASCERPVWTCSLSWAIGETPDREHMIASAREAQKTVGMEGHEALYVAHNDEEYAHIHLIVNRVHPETGKVAELSHTKLKLSKWAKGYEEEHGIHCEQRVENWKKRDQGQFAKYREAAAPNPERISELYHQSDSGKAFVAALRAEGYELAQGRKLLLIDHTGQDYSLSRQINGAKAPDIRKRLAGIQIRDIDTVREEIEARQTQEKESDQKAGEQQRQQEKKAVAQDEVAAQMGHKRRKKAQAEEEYWDRDEAERKRLEAIDNAAIQAEKERMRAGKQTESGDSGGARRKWMPKEQWQKKVAAEKAAQSWKSPEQLNREQSERHARQAAFTDNILRKKWEMERKLEQQYGEPERALRDQIRELETTMQKRGKGARLLRNLTGKQKADQEQLEGLKKNLENVEWRKSEVVNTFEKERQIEEARFRRELEKDYGPSPAPDRPKPKQPAKVPQPSRDFEPAAAAEKTTSPPRQAAPSQDRELAARLRQPADSPAANSHSDQELRQKFGDATKPAQEQAPKQEPKQQQPQQGPGRDRS